MTLLSDYEVQVADLLHDTANAQFNLAKLDRYINEARRQVVMDTGALRSLQQSYVTQGQEQYTFGQVTGALITNGGSGYTGTPTVAFSGGGGTGVAATLGISSAGAVNSITFTSFGSGYTSAPTAAITGTGTNAAIDVGILNLNTFDVLTTSVYWGNERVALLWRPFSKFSAVMRNYQASSYQSRPAVWAAYGQTSIFVGPAPDQTYKAEFDTIILPTPLVDYVTNDAIPITAQDPIKFYAAYLAKFTAQSYGEAEMHLAQYNRVMQESSNRFTRRIPDPYGGV